MLEYHFNVIQRCDGKKLKVLGFRFHSYPVLVVEGKKRLSCADACTSLLVDLKLKKKRHLKSVNLQYNTPVRWADGTNDSSTKGSDVPSIFFL